jgi:hypothetical protein
MAVHPFVKRVLRVIAAEPLIFNYLLLVARPFCGVVCALRISLLPLR